MRRVPRGRRLKYWDWSNAKAAVEKAQRLWGAGWNLLTEEAQTKAVEAEAFELLIMIPPATEINGAAILELYRASLYLAGLLED